MTIDWCEGTILLSIKIGWKVFSLRLYAFMLRTVLINWYLTRTLLDSVQMTKVSEGEGG